MGNGYCILLWDGWGAGCVRINPRLHTDGVDMYGNPKNWWPTDGVEADNDILERHGLAGVQHYKIILN